MPLREGRGLFDLEEPSVSTLSETEQLLPIPQPESHLLVPFVSK